MSFDDKLDKLRANTQEIITLNGISALLGWDQQVNMPVAAAEERGQQLALLGGLIYDKTTSQENGELLSDLEAELKNSSDEDLKAEVNLIRRQYNQLTRIPKALNLELIRATTISHGAWAKAKAENDFASFEPHLTHLVELIRQVADCFGPNDHPYDALLETYDPGLKTAEVQAIFGGLRERQVALVRAISEAQQVDDSFRWRTYDVSMQRKLNPILASRLGYDWQRGRLDESAHPFTTGFGLDDVRITTHYSSADALSSVFSTLHETGHALYEQGLNRKQQGTVLASTLSSSLHESQSRLWENMVGRSRQFWKFFYPTLQAFFPENLAEVNLDTFYRGINKVTSSFIRTEADEATYNLHIMLRMELEIGLLSGELKASELPELWREKMREYLGVTPPDDTRGVLQDVHWSGAMFGYFPTYALGNLISAQLWHKLLAEHPEIPEEMANGELSTILNWLRENVHQYGSRYTAAELVRKVTGTGISPDPYLDYLTAKYSDIYRL